MQGLRSRQSNFLENRKLMFFFFFFFFTAVSAVARSATAAEDYVSALSGPADFEATDDTEATVMLTIMNDMNIESTEQLELTLTVPPGDGVVGEVGKAVVNILDDDAPGMFIKLQFLCITKLRGSFGMY